MNRESYFEELLGKIAAASGVEWADPEKRKDSDLYFDKIEEITKLFSGESFQVEFYGRKTEISSDLYGYNLNYNHPLVVWSKVEDYFNIYINVEDKLVMRQKVLDLCYEEASIGEFTEWIRGQADKYKMPHGEMLIQDMLYTLFSEDTDIQDDLEKKVLYEVGKKLTPPQQVSSYKEAYELLNEQGLGISLKYKGDSIFVPLPEEWQTEHFEAVTICFLEWLSDETDMYNISPVLDQIRLLESCYRPLFELLDAYQAKYDKLKLPK